MKNYLGFLLLVGCLQFCFLSNILAQDSLQNVEIITPEKPYPVFFTHLFRAEETAKQPLLFENRNQFPLQVVAIDTAKEYGFKAEMGKAIWVHTKLYSQLPTDKEVFFTVGFAEKIDVYVEYSNGKIEQGSTGNSFATNQRSIKQSNSQVKLFLPKQQIIKIWLKIHQQLGDGYVFLQLNNPEKTTATWFDKYFSYSLLLGAFFIMFVYNFVLSLILRDKAYFYYCLYILFSALFIAYIFLPQEIGWIGNNLDHKWLVHIFLIGNVPILYNFFIIYFVQLHQIAPKVARWNDYYFYFRHTINFVFYFLTYNGMKNTTFNTYGNLVLLCDIAEGIFLIFVIIKYGKNKVLNRFLLAGSGCLFIGGGVDTLNALFPFISSYLSFFAIGSAAEILVFSFGLGYRSRLVEKEKQVAQAELIKQLQANEEMQQNINKELERKVQERTAEIAHKNEELETQSNQLQEQKDHLQHAYTHITDSVRYAKRIQTALLPPATKLQEVFPQSFIFYKPKDIVSGDFYFFAQNPQDDNQIFFAVADCTGHGVPGAFMTVIGNNLLSKIITERQLLEPAQILAELDKNLLTTLQQQGVETSKDRINDGMDIALIRVDKAKNEMVLSSAKRVVYQFRAEQLIEHEPNKFPIGSSHFGEKTFVQHSFAYLPQDVFYLFTDGYPDQFGGAENRKFMIKNFRNLLTSLHTLPPNEQLQQLQKEIDQWKGNTPQTDDILVVGIKI